MNTNIYDSNNNQALSIVYIEWEKKAARRVYKIKSKDKRKSK